MALKVCAEPGCPNLCASTRCTPCARVRDKARGTRQARGYDAHHDQLRAAFQSQMDAGRVLACWRCGNPLKPDAWRLGHCDINRNRYHGPECIPCNQATAGRIGCPHPSHVTAA